MDERPIIVKIGGSLITRKSGYCEHDSERTLALGRELSKLQPALRHRLIVLLGGGSFSHGIALRYGILKQPLQAVRADFSRITIELFRMVATVVEAWRALGVDAYPIQAAAAAHYRDGELTLASDHFSTCLAHGLIPMMCGDIAIARDGSMQIISTDRIPVMLARTMPIARVIFMTDVPGIIDRVTGATIPTVLRHSAQAALANAGDSSNPDVSGGMAEKLKSALALSTLGVGSLIVDGRGAGALSASLSGNGWFGTEIVA